MRIRGTLVGVAVTAAVSVGALAIAAPAGAAVALETRLLGANEVPGPGDGDGEGGARVRIDIPDRRICYGISVRRIDLPAIGAHIHRGRAGVAGPVKVTLNNPTRVDTTGLGLSFGCETGLSKALLRRIRSNPPGFYVNIHTSAYPDGAVRGQLG
jgi:hypothetical protein